MPIPRRRTMQAALAALAVPSVPLIPDNSPTVAPEVLISYGQSWRSNSFDSFAVFNQSTQPGALVPLLIPQPTVPPLVPGPLPNGAGIFLPSTPNGFTKYQPADVIAIGRCAVLAQQLLRVRDGLKTVTPIVEFCAAYPSSTWTSGTGGGLGPNTASFTGAISGTTLTVSAVAAGSLRVGVNVTGFAGALANTHIAALGTGTGGTGTYTLDKTYGSIGSTAMSASGQSWANMLAIIAALNALLPRGKYLPATYRSVGYSQAASDVNTVAAKLADLTAMYVAFDAILPSPALNFFFGQPAPISEATQMQTSWFGTTSFCRTNAPGQGGTYSGRCWAATTWYQWPFSGPNDPAYGDIHTGPYGTVREGEMEGYVRWLVQDKAVNWTPLWRSLSLPISIAGQVVTVPFDRPNSPDFAAGVMSFQNNADDGIMDWPQKGFNVIRGGAQTLTISSVVISGLNIQLTITETLSPGDSLEVSYAYYGPSVPVPPGASTGVGGNLVMQGPPSVLFPNGWNNVAKTIDAWAWPFLTNVTV